MLGTLVISGAQASPKERLKVKYKIKKSNNNGEQLEKQKVRLGLSVEFLLELKYQTGILKVFSRVPRKKDN